MDVIRRTGGKIEKATEHECEMMKERIEVIRRGLAKENVGISVAGERVVMRRGGNDGEEIGEEWKMMEKGFLERAEAGIDEAEMVEEVVRGGCEMIRERHGEGTFPDSRRVEVARIVPSGEKETVGDELSFMAAGSRMMFFPDPLTFGEEHEAQWREVAPVPGRTRRDFHHAAVYAPLHELIHLMQYRTIGPTKPENMWQKEFGACVAQLNFAARLGGGGGGLGGSGGGRGGGRGGGGRGGIVAGISVKEAVVWYCQVVRRLMATAGVNTPEVEEGFERWRESAGGRDAPTKDGMDPATLLATSRKVGFLLKARLALEAFNGGSDFDEFVAHEFPPSTFAPTSAFRGHRFTPISRILGPANPSTVSSVLDVFIR